MNIQASKRLMTVVSLLFFFNLLGCASYQSKVGDARQALVARNYDKALKELEPLASKENGDQLAYLLDYATALQIAGQIKESNKIFLTADRLSDQVDYQSISRQTGSLLLNQEMVQYKGDTFEKIFINAYLALNYLQIGMLDDALVEARRINEKYLKYRSEEKKSFELNSFSKYLSALIWEADKNYDDSYIAYSEAYKIDPTIGPIKEDLIRLGKLSRRTDSYNEWKKTFPEVKEQPAWYDKSLGELIVIYEDGWGPRKYPSRNQYSLPSLVPIESHTNIARLILDGAQPLNLKSSVIYDVQNAAIQTLKDDYAALVAKRIAGKVAKVAASEQIRKQNKLLGDLSYIAMSISDRADLRQWSLLPKSIQLIRVSLPPGKYKFSLKGETYYGIPTGEDLNNQEVELKSGQKKFIIWRSLK